MLAVTPPWPTLETTLELLLAVDERVDETELLTKLEDELCTELDDALLITELVVPQVLVIPKGLAG